VNFIKKKKLVVL